MGNVHVMKGWKLNTAKYSCDNCGHVQIQLVHTGKVACIECKENSGWTKVE